MLEFTILLRGTEAFQYSCRQGSMSWCNLEGILTPPDRIRLKNDDIWIERPMSLFLFGGAWELLGCSSARFKVVRDEALDIGGRT